LHGKRRWNLFRQSQRMNISTGPSWLHKSLETYRVPKKIVGRPTRLGIIPRRIFPVFRDRDELPGAADLGGKLKNALRQSRYLIVICSPHSAKSQWVNEEVKTFKALGREDRVLCLIVGGEPFASNKEGSELEECFPPAVRYRVNESGELTDVGTEPIAADARKGKDGRVNSRFKLLAGILEIGYNELKQREKQRERAHRIRLAATTAAVFLVTLLAYLGIADAGLNIPGGERVRLLLDRYDISAFRHVHSEAEIRDTALVMRQKLFGALRNGQTKEGWFSPSLRPNVKQELEWWSNAQALSAVLSVPDAKFEDRDINQVLRGFLPALEFQFAPGASIEVGGTRYGWISHPGDTHTQAEPAIWTAIALAKALGRPGLLEGEARRVAEERFRYTQEVLKIYRPLDTGGWNMFPKQKEPSNHNLYTTALALLALLEARNAGLPWEGTTERRDQLLKATAQWLIDTYDDKANPPGWRSTSESTYETIDGLTLQIYSELLRAEAEAGITLPPGMVNQISNYLKSCAQRTLSFPAASGEFSEIIIDRETGKETSDREAIGFLWYPWTINASVWWLRRAERVGEPMEERVRVRRTLSKMVVTLGEEAAQKSGSEWTFQAAETLYALSVISPP
jgi:hypothetical protein